MTSLGLASAPFARAAEDIVVEGRDSVAGTWPNIDDEDLNPNQVVTDFDNVDTGSSKVRTAIIEHSRLVFAKKQEVIEKEKEQPKPSNAKVEKNKKGGAKSKPQPTSEPMIDEL